MSLKNELSHIKKINNIKTLVGSPSGRVYCPSGKTNNSQTTKEDLM